MGGEPIIQETLPKISNLKVRIASGVVLGAVSLGAVHLGGLYFTVLVVLVALLMVFEWNRISDPEGFGPMTMLHGFFLVAGLVLGALELDLAGLAVLLAGAVVAAGFASLRGRPVLWPLLAMPYIGLPCLAMLWLRYDAVRGTALVYWLLASIWATDTGAYLVGRTVGGPRLAPRISPKKTWSGLIGGVVAAGIAGGLTAWAVDLPRPFVFGLISGLVGAWSQVGDLSESAVKRHFGVKDSSNLIPGHGGFLDRLDGLLFAAPVAAAAVLLGAL